MTTNFEDLRQSEEWKNYLKFLGWETDGVSYVRKLPLLGSLIKIQRPSKIPSVGEVNNVARKNRALFVKLEPACRPGQTKGLQLQAVSKHFEPDKWPLLPSKTIWLDLTPSEEEIFNRFSKDARYSVRKAQNLGVVVVCKAWPCEALETFHRLFSETGKRKKFWVPPFKDLQAKTEAFKDKSALIFACHNSKAIAGALILFHDQVAYYHHAASDLTGRKLLAPYLIVWEAIKISKKFGCHTLDLEGIYDPRYKIYRRWKNISIFKKKFGGKEIEYPGSYIRFYNPLIKILFKLGDGITQVGI